MKITEISLYWRLIGGLALIAGAVFVFDPSLVRAALPFLVIAACPLAMMLMMRGMGGMGGGQGVSTGRLARRVESDPGPGTPAPVDLDQLRQELDGLAARQAFIRAELQALESPDNNAQASLEAASEFPDGAPGTRPPS